MISNSEFSKNSIKLGDEEDDGTSKIFFLQEGEPLYLADPKYIYEQAIIATDKIGNKDYKIFRYNNRIGAVEYYDIVACTYNHTFGKLFIQDKNLTPLSCQ